MEKTSRPDSLVSRPAFAFLYVAMLAITAAAAIRATLAAHADREMSKTGRAEWIWYTREVKEPAPIAFVATRDVVLDRAPSRAMAKIFADRWHVLWVNGQRAGSGRQQPGDPLILHEIAELLSRGVNRIAIEAGRETGVVGVVFLLLLEGARRGVVFSGAPRRAAPSPVSILSGGRDLVL